MEMDEVKHNSERRARFLDEYVEQLGLKRRKLHSDSNVTGGNYISLPPSAVVNSDLWKVQVSSRGVPRKCVEPATCSHPVLIALRWLHLRLRAPRISLTDQLTDRQRKHSAGARRLESETQYHPVILEILTSAAAGQDQVRFAGEAFNERIAQSSHNVEHAVREDIRCFVGKEEVQCHPSESKSVIVEGATDLIAIDSNREPFGQLLKVIAHRKMFVQSQVQFCLFFTNIWAVHEVVFTYTLEGVVTDVTICPPLPRVRHNFNVHSRLMEASKGLAALERDDAKMASLLDCMPCSDKGFEPPPGFELLCQHITGIAIHHHLPVPSIHLFRQDGSEIDQSSLAIVYHGPRSIVLEGPEFSLKLLPLDVMNQELIAHTCLDSFPFIRKSLGSIVLQPAVFGMGGLLLEGPAVPVTSAIVRAHFDVLFPQALAAVRHVHEKGLVHRDVKLSNMVLKGDALKLNDFETVCRLPISQPCHGTPIFHSGVAPLHFQPVDDLFALALSFAEPFIENFGHLSFNLRCAALLHSLTLIPDNPAKQAFSVLVSQVTTEIPTVKAVLAVR